MLLFILIEGQTDTRAGGLDFMFVGGSDKKETEQE